MKKIVFFISVCLLAGMFFAACSKSNNDNELRLGLVVNDAKLEDNGFNSSLVQGADSCRRMLGIELKSLAGSGVTAMVNNMQTLINENYNLIIVSASGETDAVLTMVANNPSVKFILMDNEVDITRYSNLQNIFCRAEQPAFLIGYLSASQARSMKGSGTSATIGFIGGYPDIPAIENIRKGYEKGAAYYDSNNSWTTNVSVEYVRSFVDPTKARSQASAMYAQGINVVYAVAGGSSEGVYQCAKEVSAIAMGSDVDVALRFPQWASAVMTSNLKNYPDMIYRAVSDIKNNGFRAKQYEGNLANGGATLAPIRRAIDADTQAALDDIAAKIANGTIDPL